MVGESLTLGFNKKLTNLLTRTLHDLRLKPTRQLTCTLRCNCKYATTTRQITNNGTVRPSFLSYRLLPGEGITIYTQMVLILNIYQPKYSLARCT